MLNSEHTSFFKEPRGLRTSKLVLTFPVVGLASVVPAGNAY